MDRHADKDQEPDRPLVLLFDPDRDTDEPRRMEPFRVVRVEDARSCVELAEHLLPEAIVVDLGSPSVDGGELVLMLEAHPRAWDVPVILVPPAAREVEDALARLETLYSPHAGRLVSLPGRSAFRRRLEEEVARSRRSGAPLSILIVEIDDAPGVGERDLVVRRAAVALRTHLRRGDSLFLYGDNAFAAIFPDTDAATAFPAAERVRETLRRSEFGSGRATASVGVADLRPRHSAEDLIVAAEAALVRARESGGDQTWRSDDPRRHPLDPLALAGALTEREWDVFAELARRRTEQEIAARFGISAGTVRSHKARIRRKLQIAPNLRLTDFASEHFGKLAAGRRHAPGAGQ